MLNDLWLSFSLFFCVLHTRALYMTTTTTVLHVELRTEERMFLIRSTHKHPSLPSYRFSRQLQMYNNIETSLWIRFFLIYFLLGTAAKRPVKNLHIWEYQEHLSSRYHIKLLRIWSCGADKNCCIVQISSSSCQCPFGIAESYYDYSGKIWHACEPVSLFFFAAHKVFPHKWQIFDKMRVSCTAKRRTT